MSNISKAKNKKLKATINNLKQNNFKLQLELSKYIKYIHAIPKIDQSSNLTNKKNYKVPLDSFNYLYNQISHSSSLDELNILYEKNESFDDIFKKYNINSSEFKISTSFNVQDELNKICINDSNMPEIPKP